jgi:alpha-ribazole phosphatase
VKKRLLLLRHARHAASDHNCFFGSTDISLSEAGCLEAASIAPLVHAYQPERCFCSPLKRCVETIKPILGLPVALYPDLREIDFGNWEGMTFSQIHKSDPAAVDRWASYDPEFSFSGGERIADFLARVGCVADAFVSCPEKTILAVTHAGIIRALICHFLGLNPRQYLLFQIEFASLTILDLFDGNGVLVGLNQCCLKEKC